MNRSDEAIDKVLGALREVEAPVGMERRVLAALEERAAARRQTWSWVPAAGVVVAAMAIAGVWLGHRTVPETPVVVARQNPVQMVQPEIKDSAVVTRPTPHVKQRRGEWGTQGSLAKTTAPVEMSMVAPPLPLTDQERMLVQVARRGLPEAMPVLDESGVPERLPEKLPVLDPDKLVRREAESEAKFRAMLAARPEVETVLDEKGEIQ